MEPTAAQNLIELLSLSIKTQVIPSVWKVGRIILKLKSGNPIDQGSSYRPISLMSSVAKKLQLLTLTDHLQPADLQHGFLATHATPASIWFELATTSPQSHSDGGVEHVKSF